MIWLLIILGGIAGLIVGAASPNEKFGCILLLGIPAVAIAYVAWWQAMHPESLRSTSGLEYIFAPLWPSSGALAGFFFSRWLRST